jgi:two-component system, OmpR family, phosphate regulon sensor histidine kinase PhoR
MNFSKASVLAFWLSVGISVLFLACGILIGSFSDTGFRWDVLIIASCSMLVLVYFIQKFVLEKYIYEKIRPIYKTILSQKNPKGKKVKYEIDSINNVNQQVIQWAEDKTKEIDELKKLEAYRREFLGNVSHELKTPIFNIQGYVLTLLDGGLEDETINRNYLERSEKSINRMITIIEDLETISKLETGELVPEMSQFDILSVTKEVFEFLELNAEKKNISLKFGHGSEKPLMVYADKKQIHQVLTNLVDNSIKYGNENGYSKVSFYDMDETILVEVADNGIGVSQSDIPRLFERFYRTDKSRSREQGGSGLGLSIVKHIIEAHHQTINLRSTIGVGSTFSFTLKKR